MTDPMICLAKCFSSWIAIQIVMGFLLVWLIIMMGLSGWLYESDRKLIFMYIYTYLMNNFDYHMFNNEL